MSTLLLTHSAFVNHLTGEGHPERPDRMRALDKALSADAFSALVREEAPLRDDAEDAILRAHPRDIVEAVKRARPAEGRPSVRIDADTVMSPGSWEAAMRAVGAGLRAVDAVMTNEHKTVFCQVRPPGHHAERERPMGFCFFGSVAVAAMYAQAKYGVERVAVVDFDVHHGNGTQDIFWAHRNLFLASTHQMPLYPGTGAVNETGEANNICNAPLNPDDGGRQFKEAFQSRVLPALSAFEPELVIISAGFDAHKDDPLANLRLVEDDFDWATRKIADVAHKYSSGRIVSMLEGGYNLAALANSGARHVTALMDAGR
jgi:acetoin utilization deacetylase AcuC-like enzyme